jgi:predicted pyridoxine 5'-phosphate oxidase superfamily flavin-nucleotide-binding protein
MALTVGPRLQSFFDEKLAAILTTLNDKGSPEMTPVWYEFRAAVSRIVIDPTTKNLVRRHCERRRSQFPLIRTR